MSSSHVIPEQSQQARITSPLASRIIATDAHLPALNPALFTPTDIACALQGWQAVAPLATGDGNRFAGRSPRAAAVLLGLVQRDEEVHLILTQRASHLRDHAGQIALPGGAQDATDRDSWHTAQREAWEEIGIPASQLQYLGRCHPYATVTAFEVTPCVAWVDPTVQYTAAPDEVAQVFELPLAHVLNPAHHQRRSVTTPVGERTFYAIPSVDTQGVERFVWGATAGILRNFYATLKTAQ